VLSSAVAVELENYLDQGRGTKIWLGEVWCEALGLESIDKEGSEGT